MYSALKTYIKSIKNQSLLALDLGNKLHIVMGNESADLDSIASSIAYAYLLKHQALEGEPLYCPLIPTTKGDLSLRKDVIYLLQLLHIEIEDLLFLDEVPLQQLVFKGLITVSLVDHNLLTPSLEFLAPSVTSIIDHHRDENAAYAALLDKQIESVGSTASLIAEKWFEKNSIPSDVAMLLLSTILIDTHNLQSKEKTTRKDQKMVEYLKTAVDQPLYLKRLYLDLLKAKQDISTFTPLQILYKDFKVYKSVHLNYGIAALSDQVSWWMGDEDFLQPILKQVLENKKLNFIFLLMNDSHSLLGQRKLLLFCLQPILLNQIDEKLRRTSALKEILKVEPSSQNLPFKYYTTHIPISRKHLQPLIHDAI